MSLAKKFRLGLTTLALALVSVALVACGGNGDDNGNGTDPGPGNNVPGGTGGNQTVDMTPEEDDIWQLPFDTEGEITLFMWNGTGTFHRDIGNPSNAIPAEQLMARQDAQMHAAAQAFNQVFPNITVNAYARVNGPNDDGISWDQYRENFRMEHGHYPDVFTVDNLVNDFMRGVIADLTIFADDPVFQTFNPALMELGQISGRQFGLPQYVIPHGIFVNYTLAEQNNIDVPNPNWTLDEYMRFVSNSNHEGDLWFGAMSFLWVIGDTGTMDFRHQLVNRGPNDPFVNLNSEATRNVLATLWSGAEHYVWQSPGSTPEFRSEHWSWGHRFFHQGRILTNAGNPYMMGALAAEGTDGAATMPGWDIFPRPATPYRGNHVGIIYDPIAVRNFAMDDNNPVLSPEEYANLAIAFEFVKFMTGDTRSWEARANQYFNTGGGMAPALHDSFPLVTGPAFYEQMEIWFRGPRARFADPVLMPGFQYVLHLWEQGEICTFSDKSSPWHHEFEGSRRLIAFEWLNKHTAGVAGVGEMDPAWLDNVFALLPEWDRVINQRFEDAFAELDEALARWYPEQVRGGR